MMKGMLAGLMVFVLFSGPLMGDERIRGRLDSVQLAKNRVVVNGTEYEVNTELTQVLYKGLDVGEEGLSKGDQVELVLREAEGNSPAMLLAIVLLRGSKSGLDS